jgi:hypothetical protein
LRRPHLRRRSAHRDTKFSSGSARLNLIVRVRSLKPRTHEPLGIRIALAELP